MIIDDITEISNWFPTMETLFISLLYPALMGFQPDICHTEFLGVDGTPLPLRAQFHQKPHPNTGLSPKHYTKVGVKHLL